MSFAMLSFTDISVIKFLYANAEFTSVCALFYTNVGLGEGVWPTYESLRFRMLGPLICGSFGRMLWTFLNPALYFVTFGFAPSTVDAYIDADIRIRANSPGVYQNPDQGDDHNVWG